MSNPYTACDNVHIFLIPCTNQVQGLYCKFITDQGFFSGLDYIDYPRVKIAGHQWRGKNEDPYSLQYGLRKQG